MHVSQPHAAFSCLRRSVTGEYTPDAGAMRRGKRALQFYFYSSVPPQRIHVSVTLYSQTKSSRTRLSHAMIVIPVS